MAYKRKPHGQGKPAVLVMLVMDSLSRGMMEPDYMERAKTDMVFVLGRVTMFEDESLKVDLRQAEKPSVGLKYGKGTKLRCCEKGEGRYRITV